MKKLLKNLVSSQKLCTFAPAFDKQRSVLSEKCSGFSAVGSAHVWGARGRWFESSNPDQKKIQTTMRRFGFLFCCVLFLFPRLAQPVDIFQNDGDGVVL